MKTTFDAIVIGAGVLGTSTAAHLAERGYSVLLLERGDAASGASGGNLGQISISDRCEPWHLPLALQSQTFYKEVLSKEYSIEYNQCGGCVALKGEAQLVAGLEVQKKMQACGLEAILYYGEDIHKVEPSLNLEAVDAVLFSPDEGKMNPLLVTVALLEKAKAAGAVYLHHTPVTAMTRKDNKIDSVVTPVGTFCANWVVNCAGPRAAFVAEMAGLSIPIRFHKGTAFVSQPMPAMINGPIVGGGFFLAPLPVRPARSIGFGTTQTADGSILIAQSTEECESDDRSVNMPSLQLVAKRFLQYFPQLHDLQIVRAWAACTTYTEDDLPVFGFSAKAENFFTVAGFKGAFTTAPAVGHLTADALEGKMDAMYQCCNPDR